MDELLKDLTTVAVLFVMVAIVGLLVSKQGNATGVLNSASSAFNSGLATAQAAVTGYTPGPPIYASSSGMSFADSLGGLENGAGFNTLSA